MVDNITVHEVEGVIYDHENGELADFNIGPAVNKSPLEAAIEGFEDNDDILLVQHRYNTIERGETERNDSYYDN